MKKKLVKVILGLILIAAISSPYFAGRTIENQYHDFIVNAAEFGKDYVIITGKFTRGFFASTAVTEIKLKNSFNSIQLVHSIKHGPVIFDFKSATSPASYIPQAYKLASIKTEFAGALQKQIQDLYKSKPAYEMLTTVDYNKNVNTDIKIMPLQKDSTDKAYKLNWSGGKINILNDVELNKAKFSMSMPSLKYDEYNKSNVINYVMDNTALDIEVEKSWNLKLKFAIENVKISDKEKNFVDLQKYALSVEKKDNNNVTSLVINNNFTKMVLEGDVYGPFDFNLKLDNWDSETIKKVFELSQNQEAVTLATKDPNILALIKKVMSIDVDFKLTTPEGDISWQSDMQVGGNSITQIDPIQIKATLVLVQKVQISKNLLYTVLTTYARKQIANREAMYYLQNRTSTVVNPYTLTNDQLTVTINNWINKLIEQLIAQNYILQKDDSYITDVKLEKNVMTINGVVKTDDDMKQMQNMMEVIPPPVVPPVTNTTTIPNTQSPINSPMQSAPTTPMKQTTPPLNNNLQPTT